MKCAKWQTQVEPETRPLKHASGLFDFNVASVRPLLNDSTHDVAPPALFLLRFHFSCHSLCFCLRFRPSLSPLVVDSWLCQQLCCFFEHSTLLWLLIFMGFESSSLPYPPWRACLTLHVIFQGLFFPFAFPSFPSHTRRKLVLVCHTPHLTPDRRSDNDAALDVFEIFLIFLS